MSEDDIEPTMEYAHLAMDVSVTRYLLNVARTTNTLYYPDSAVDWQVMGRMTDVVRAFVFCKQQRGREPDNLLSLAHCPRMLRSLFTLEGCGDVDIQTVRKAGILPSLRSGSCLWLCREIEVGGEAIKRKLFVASLEADPVEVYRDLFIQRGVGAKFLCIHKSGWDGALKAAVLNAGPAMPKYLIGDDTTHLQPWLLRWRRYPYWGKTTIYQRRSEPQHPVAEFHALDNFGVGFGPFRPPVGFPNYAVHLTLDDYLDDAWQGAERKIFIDTADQQLIAAIMAQDNRVEPLRLHGRPLRDALPALADACFQRGIRTV